MNKKRIVAILIFVIMIFNILIPNIALAVEEATNIQNKMTENKVDNNTTIEDKKITENKNQTIENTTGNEINENAHKENENIDNVNKENGNTGNENKENETTKNEITEDRFNSNEVNETNNIEENKKQEVQENNTENMKEENLKIDEQTLETKEKTSNLSVSYKTHVQYVGWQNYVQDGEMAGTENQSLRLEAIDIKLANNTNENIGIKYQVHAQNYGWMDWKHDGEMAGTQDEALRLEAIKIDLENSEKYSIMYRVHIQNIGWQEWKTDGEIAGTEGQSLRLEAIEIKIIEKQKKGKLCVDTPSNGTIYYNKETSNISVVGWKMANVSNSYIKAYLDGKEIDEKTISYYERPDVIQAITDYGTEKQNPTPGFRFDINTTNFENRNYVIKIELYSENTLLETISKTVSIDGKMHVQYRTHVQYVGWQNYVQDGEMAGTQDQSLRLEAINLKLVNCPEESMGIKYQVHAQNYGWMDWKHDGEMAGTQDEGLRLEAIKIDLENSENYSVMYRVHIQNIGWQDWKQNGEIAGTEGRALKLEAIEVKLVKKPKIEINYTYNKNNNTVTATIKSDKMLSSISDNSWNLSADKLSYSKQYDSNDIYNVTVTDIDGIENQVQININQVVEPISMIKYSSHIQLNGWEKTLSKIDGETSGTTDEGKRLEAIKISLGTSEKIPENASIKYQAHVQYYGWMDWVKDGEIAGTVGENKRLEAIKIELEGFEGYCVEYRVYVQDTGWQKWRSNGEIAGTTNEEKRIEAIQIKIVKEEEKTVEPRVEYQSYIQNSGWQEKVLENTITGKEESNKRIESLKIELNGVKEGSSIKYRVYTNNLWQDWKNSSEIAGTIGQSIEAIQINLENLEGYSIEYRVYISGYGWQKWRKNGETAGIVGNNIEAIQIRIVYNTSETIEPEVSYQVHVQGNGWMKENVEDTIAGTTGEEKRIEAIKISLSDVESNQRIKYRAHVEGIGWQPWVRNGATSGTTGQNKRIEAIQIELENMDKYTVEYQVHIQDYGWSNWMIDGETAGTTGQNKRIEAIKIRIVPKYYRTYKGIDVSEHNGLIDWQSVKNSGVQFAMIRCAYRGYGTGKIVTDAYFDYNIQNASAVGIQVGIYFFSQATSITEAVEEANYAISLAQKYNCVTYPIVIDTEYSGAPNNTGRADNLGVALRTNIIAAFCNQVEKLGYISMVYASRDWLYNNLEITRLSNYETWLAHYTNDPSKKSDYKYNYGIWQYTSSGSVPGIGGRVDLNVGYKKY